MLAVSLFGDGRESAVYQNLVPLRLVPDHARHHQPGDVGPIARAHLSKQDVNKELSVGQLKEATLPDISKEEVNI